MNYLLQAIMTKLSGSSLSTYVGNRIYLDRAQEGAALPYVVFFIVGVMPDKTFSEDYEDVYIQFSLFSSSSGVTEITTMYNYLIASFDECSLTITGSTLVWMKRSNLATMVEDVTINNAAVSLKHWAVDYNVLLSTN